jgi:hypothetical protein
MIKGLMGGPGVVVVGGNTTLPYVPQNSNNPIQGMIRVNNQDLEVFNGSTWTIMSTNYATVNLDPDTQDLLQWARAQRTMAMNRIELAQSNPALLKALEAIKRAEDNFEILSKFVENDSV